MKKRNKHFLKEKEHIRLNKRLDEIRQIQRNLGWAELPEPKFIGWKAKIRPRQDILNREDDWVFIGISDLFGTESFARKIDHFEWELKRKHPKDRFVQHTKPHIRTISQHEYDSLVPQAKRWFDLDTHSSGWRNWYYCKIPNFYWEIHYEKEYQTKVRISDVLLEREEAEIKKRLYWDFRDLEFRMSNSPKSFRKKLNRKQRAKSKQTLYRIVTEGLDLTFEDNFRGAAWLYW